VVEFVETASKTVLLSEVAENTSFSLQNLNLPTASEYFIRVRTFNNDVYSDWASVDVSITGLSGVESEKMTISTEGNRLIVNSEIAQPFDLFAIDGRLVRSVNLIAGRNEINGLAKGFYLAKKQKISIK